VRALLAVTVVLACCACGGRTQTTRVPDLRGLSAQTALERLAGARLCPGRVEFGAPLGAGTGRVVAQRPRAGSRVRLLHPVSFRTGGAAGPEIVDVIAAEGCPPPPTR
jgi:hypothetical protein